MRDQLSEHGDQRYAMKVYGNLFNKDVELMKSVWNELFLVRAMRTSFGHGSTGGHPNIVQWIRHVQVPPFEHTQFNYAASLYELMDADLHFALQHNQLTIREVRHCLFDVLCALDFLHSNQMVHQNISSQTVLVSKDFDVKLTNFRHCVHVHQIKAFSKTYLTANIKNYRAPEILMQSFDLISLPIDLFAVGCLFAEMLLGRPLFEARHYLEQLEQLVKLVGVPEMNDNLLSGVSYLASKSLKRVADSGQFHTDRFEETFPMLEQCPEAMHLLKQLLAFWPKDRIDVREAIRHPFFDCIRQRKEQELNQVLGVHFGRGGACGCWPRLRHPEFKLDMYYERPLLLKNLIYNELMLGVKPRRASMFDGTGWSSNVQQYSTFSDVEIVTSSHEFAQC